MSECSAAGYSDSSLTAGCFWAMRLSAGESWPSEEEEEEVEEESSRGDREAKSSSPAVSSLVTLQNNWPPGNTEAALVTGNYCHLSVMEVVLRRSITDY